MTNGFKRRRGCRLLRQLLIDCKPAWGLEGHCFAVAIFVATCAAPYLIAAAAPITVPAGLHSGDHYRLAFVTGTDTPATSSDIAYYNTFVTSAADSVSQLAALGTTWSAIASTATVAARDNTNTNPASAGAPIYNMAGQLLATSNADLWDGSLSALLTYNETGAVAAPGFTEAWTGTGSAGMPTGSSDPLGTAAPVWGDSQSAMIWVYAQQGEYLAPAHHTLYGISGMLTVSPEPSSLVLASLAGVALTLLWLVRCGRRQVA